MQHELHVHKKVAQPDAQSVARVAAHALPAPASRDADKARRASVELALERSSVQEALGMAVEEGAMAPSPHRALIGDESSRSSGNSDEDPAVYLALSSQQELYVAEDAGRAVPPRLKPRKQPSKNESSTAAAQASLSELNSAMMQEGQKHEEEELAELARAATRPPRLKGRKGIKASPKSSPRKSPRDSDFSDVSSPRDELSVSSAGQQGDIVLSDKKGASRVRI